MDKHPMIGRIIADDYEIESFLGRGGMGSVFGGKQISLNRKVAIKLLPALDMAPAEVQRFEREIATMTTISHLNIVTIYHRGKFGDPPTLFYVMELMEGGSLRSFLNQNGKMLASNVLRLVRPVAEALFYAHQQGCIHRDIKPDNLLFDRNYRNLKIADFGIAKLKSDASNITKSNAMMGTFIYAAPEQMNWYETEEDSQEVDARSDQYALGIVIYEMICGALPYQAKNMMSLMKAMNSEPVPLSDREVSVSPSLNWLVSKMISKSREDRFATDEELLAAMDSVELEVAASVSARIFVPENPKSTKKGRKEVARDLSETEKQFIQNLRTVVNEPSKEVIQKYKNIFTIVFCIFLALACIVVYYEFLNPQNQVLQQNVPVAVNVSYDIAPKDSYPLIQMSPVNDTKKIIEVKSSFEIMPGDYKLLVSLEGYVSQQNNQIITIQAQQKVFLDIKLIAKPRIVVTDIVNLANQEIITPKEFRLNNVILENNTPIKPGNHKLSIKFNNYDEIHQETFIAPSNDPIQFNFYLQPLKELILTLDTLLTTHEGEYYPLEVFVDNNVLDKNYYQYSIDNSKLNVLIKVSTSIKIIKLRCGYYYKIINLDEGFFARDIPKLEVDILLKHLAQIQDRDKLNEQIQNLLDKDSEKIKKLSNEEKETLYKFFVSLLGGENPNLEMPGWQLRWLLNEKEKEEAKKFIEILSTNMDTEKKLQTWENFQKLYPDGVFIRKVQKNIEYLNKVINYKQTFQKSIKDCYLSLSEKRTILNLESKIEKEDVEKIYEEMEQYVKLLNCGENLEKMFKK